MTGTVLASRGVERDVEWHDAAAVADVEARPLLVRIGTRHVLIVASGTTIHATEPLCPHKFTPLEDGYVETGCLVCPTHDAHFDLATGTPRAGDEWAGQLATYPCRVVEGRVQVGLGS